MSELTERLISMRDRLNGVDPDRLNDREHTALENDRDTLADAANRIVELEAALLRVRSQWEKLNAEIDR